MYSNTVNSAPDENNLNSRFVYELIAAVCVNYTAISADEFT